MKKNAFRPRLVLVRGGLDPIGASALSALVPTATEPLDDDWLEFCERVGWQEPTGPLLDDGGIDRLSERIFGSDAAIANWLEVEAKPSIEPRRTISLDGDRAPSQRARLAGAGALCALLGAIAATLLLTVGRPAPRGPEMRPVLANMVALPHGLVGPTPELVREPVPHSEPSPTSIPAVDKDKHSPETPQGTPIARRGLVRRSSPLPSIEAEAPKPAEVVDEPAIAMATEPASTIPVVFDTIAAPDTDREALVHADAIVPTGTLALAGAKDPEIDFATQPSWQSPTASAASTSNADWSLAPTKDRWYGMGAPASWKTPTGGSQVAVIAELDLSRAFRTIDL